MGRLRPRTFALCVATFLVAGLVAAAAVAPGLQGWRVLAHTAPAQVAAAPPRPSVEVAGAQPALPIPVFASLAPPEVSTARSGVLLDLDSGHVLWAREADQPRPIASLTKIFTAMEAVSAVPDLDRSITVPLAARTQIPWDSTVMGLTPGETVSVRQLLYGMFLPSGNDAAVTLAQAILPEPQFIAGMNALAASLGLRQTHFTNPWGADDAGHHASASDLAVAAAYLHAP